MGSRGGEAKPMNRQRAGSVLRAMLGPFAKEGRDHGARTSRVSRTRSRWFLQRQWIAAGGARVRRFLLQAHARRLATSIGYAVRGLVYAIQTERHMRVHLVIAALAVGTAAILRISRIEWVLLGVVVAMVLATELLNTATEVLVDLASPEFRPQAQVIKDLAASAVLVSAVLAVVVGGVLFLPPLLSVSHS